MREISDYIKAINDRDAVLDKVSITLEEFLLERYDIELEKLLKQVNKFLDK